MATPGQGIFSLQSEIGGPISNIDRDSKRTINYQTWLFINCKTFQTDTHFANNGNGLSVIF